MRPCLSLLASTALFVTLALATGCGGGGASGSNPAVESALLEEVNAVIQDSRFRYHPIRFQNPRDFTKIAEQVEGRQSGRLSGEEGRVMPRIDLKEEDEHFRETLERWTAATGKNLREELDAFNQGRPTLDDLRERFGELLAIEEADVIARADREVQRQVEPILAKYRADHPEVVRRQEEMLAKSFQARIKPAVGAPKAEPKEEPKPEAK